MRKKAAKKPTLTTLDYGIDRMETGIASLDFVLGGGLPLRSVVEISGYEWSGKSTLGYYLCGMAAREFDGYGLADFEGCDPKYIQEASSRGGFSGEIRLVPLTDDKRQPMTGERSIDVLLDYLYDDHIGAVMLDSVGAVYPVSEEEGSVGESRVGRRAAIMAPTLRKLVHRLRWTEKSKLAVITNHVHSLIGSQGTVTSGGKAVHYLSTTRIRLNSTRNEEGWEVEGRLLKRRYGGPDAMTFGFYIIPGIGVHPGMSAVLDCFRFGLASKDRTIVLNGKSYGFQKRMVEQWQDEELFHPFQQALLEQLKKSAAS